MYTIIKLHFVRTTNTAAVFTRTDTVAIVVEGTYSICIRGGNCDNNIRHWEVTIDSSCIHIVK